MKKKIFSLLPAFFLCLLVFMAFLFFYQKQKPVRQEVQVQEPLRASEMLLNTIVSVTLYDTSDQTILDGVMQLCAKYEHIFSRTLEDSELYKLNHREGANSDGSFTVSEEFAELLEQGLDYSDLSQGAFDVSLGSLTTLWDFGSNRKTVPEDSKIQEARLQTGWQKIHLKDRNVSFDDENVRIDLGAIAKGYIADRMKDYLLEHGVKSAMINLGGNVLCVGSKPDGTPFKVGIQKPFADRNETIAIMDLTDRSVVSSGIYERYFEKDGVFYHHILDSATGYPRESDLTAVTIISDKSVDGDALSTTCFSLGLEKGLELINSLENVDAVFITKDGKIHCSQDLEL